MGPLQLQMPATTSDPRLAPFFIVGSGRSGTTLLRLILAGHSRIFIPPETWFLLPLLSHFPFDTPLKPEEALAAARLVVGHYRWPDQNISEADFFARATDLTSPRLGDIVALVYQIHLERTGKARIGDKTPPYIAIVPQLKAMYPSAKFIHLIRDGRDVAVSFVESGFAGRPYQGSSFEWTRAIRQGLALRDTDVASSLVELRYETLVSEPEETIRSICDFLGEQFEPSMMDYRIRTNMVPERERHIHSKVSQPLALYRPPRSISTSRDRTITKCSTIEYFVIESCLRRELMRLGYPLRFPRFPWWPLQKIVAWTTRALAPALKRIIPALRRRGLIRRNSYL